MTTIIIILFSYVILTLIGAFYSYSKKTSDNVNQDEDEYNRSTGDTSVYYTSNYMYEDNFKDHRYTVYAPTELLEKVNHEAYQKNITMSQVMVKIISEYYRHPHPIQTLEPTPTPTPKPKSTKPLPSVHPKDYTYILGIDFETANPSYASACAVGLHLENTNRDVLLSEHFLINPEDNFADINMGIHGITPKDVASAPTFPHIRQKIEELLSAHPNTLVIAHNTAFDVSVFRHACDRYHLPYIPFDFLCTYRLAKSLFPHYAEHSLSHLTKQFYLPRFNHHDPLADAIQAVNLFHAICARKKINDAASIANLANLKIGKLHSTGYSPCGKKYK